MSTQIVYWDEVAGKQCERNLTPEEEAAHEANTVAAAAAAPCAGMNAYLAEVRALREQILNRLAGIGLAAFVAGDQPTVDAVLTARQRLLDITKIPDALAAYAALDLAALELAVKKEYAAIVASVPPSLINAFDEIDK